MAGSVSNSESQTWGARAAPRPISSVRPAAMAAPIQAVRNARPRWPAPMLVPTIATSGPPSPKTSGTSRYSRRAPVPYPAIARGPESAGESRRDRDREIGLDRDERSHRAHFQNVAEERPPEAHATERQTDDAPPHP